MFWYNCSKMTSENVAPFSAPATSEQADLNDRVQTVRARVAVAARKAGRSPDAITIIGVTKTQEASRAALAINAGLRHLGENYIQEAQAKMPAVREIVGDAPITWHFIGHLQSNKARFAIDFDLIHTLDSVSLARAVAHQAEKRGKVQQVLIEVNTARSLERAGVFQEDVLALAEAIEKLPSLSLQGLMTIAPVADDAELVRPVFQQMHQLWEQLPEPARQVLSMGMSGDFEQAIEEGATHIRLGTVLFGARQPRVS